MAGFFALSINPETYKGNFLEDLFWETFYQQHLGHEYAGLATYDEKKIKTRTHPGLFRPNFRKDLAGLEGTEGIGYCGEYEEPILVDSRLGEFAICFSGNLINRDKLVKRFKTFGHSFAKEGIDIEVIAKLIAQGDKFTDGIKRMTQEIKGAYSLAILTEEGIYVACDPSSHWPLVVGEKTGAVVVASDPCGFENWDFERKRDLEPGEIALLKYGRLETKEKMPSDKTQICSFIWIYTNYPNATFRNIPGSLVRKKLLALLAQRDIEKGFIPDVVIPVPHSGRFPAIGYHQEFCRQINEKKIKKIPLYDEALIQYIFAGRSYLRLANKERKLEAYIKQLRSAEDFSGKIAVVCDDSIRRGTQLLENLVPKLKAVGLKEIHLRIANPESLSACPWGKTVKAGELLASQIPAKEKRIEILGVDSLEHPTIEDLAKAIGLPLETLCVDCDLPA
ncbi:MAG: hypothetical protein QME57_01885 [Patescibacteria group bacterium]|nr:hypothetical protein [Patescibacteria group bacterium]